MFLVDYESNEPGFQAIGLGVTKLLQGIVVQEVQDEGLIAARTAMTLYPVHAYMIFMPSFLKHGPCLPRVRPDVARLLSSNPSS